MSDRSFDLNNTYEAQKIVAETQSAAAIVVRDEVKLAVWRNILGGNDCYVLYRTEKGKPQGTNNQPCSTGYVSSKGVDYTWQAGWPYGYTPDVVDREMICHGPWSECGLGIRRWLAFDIEPLHVQGGKHTKVDEPTAAHIQRVRDWAYKGYAAALHLAQNEPNVAVVILVQTSETNFHLWVILADGVSRKEHDRLLDAFYKLHPKDGAVVDKDSAKAKTGLFGTHFRSPWTWKRGKRSEAVGLWIRDEEAFIRTGESLKPENYTEPGTKRPRGVKRPSLDAKTNPLAYWFQFAIGEFPLLPKNGTKGTRDKKSGQLVLSLLKRGVDPDMVKDIGAKWLEYHKPDSNPDYFYEMSLDEAVAAFESNVDRTWANPRIQKQIQERLTSSDYLAKASIMELTQQEHQSTKHLLYLTQSKVQHGMKETLSDTESRFLESLIVLVRLELGKDWRKGQPGIVKFTQGQINDVLQARGLKEISQQVQSRDLYPRFIELDPEKTPSKVCLLKRLSKGKTGSASVFELSPKFAAVLGVETRAPGQAVELPDAPDFDAVELVAALEAGDGPQADVPVAGTSVSGPSLGQDGACVIEVGSGPVPAKKTRREAQESPGLPEPLTRDEKLLALSPGEVADLDDDGFGDFLNAVDRRMCKRGRRKRVFVDCR